MELANDLLLQMVKNGEKSAITNLGFGLLAKKETKLSKVKKEAKEEKEDLQDILKSITSNIGNSVKGQFGRQIQENLKTQAQSLK